MTDVYTTGQPPAPQPTTDMPPAPAYQPATPPQPAANGFTAPGDCDEFGGWNTKPDGSGTSYKEGDMLPPLTGDLTLYAQWDESNCKAEGLAQTGISTTTTIFAAVLFTFVSTILAAFSRLLRRRS